MNEQNPEAAPVEQSAPSAPYKDRSIGLTIFGILTIIMGCFIALFIPLGIFGQATAARTGQVPFNSHMVLSIVGIYGTLAVTLVWLGIGSIMARRWARALLLIFSWAWLLMGVGGCFFIVFLMPKILANAALASNSTSPVMPVAAIDAVMFFVFGIIFVIPSIIWIIFYRSWHVKATCEARNPVPSWTDGCPLPVLCASLWLAVCVPMMLLMPLMGHVVMPFFGTFLTGVLGEVLCLGIAAIWCYAAWGLYKLQRWAWWLTFVALFVWIVSALMTFARHDTVEMERLQGLPNAQIQQMQQSGFMNGEHMMWMMLFSTLLIYGYLIFIERYLKRQPEQ